MTKERQTKIQNKPKYLFIFQAELHLKKHSARCLQVGSTEHAQKLSFSWLTAQRLLMISQNFLSFTQVYLLISGIQIIYLAQDDIYMKVLNSIETLVVQQVKMNTKLSLKLRVCLLDKTKQFTLMFHHQNFLESVIL